MFLLNKILMKNIRILLMGFNTNLSFNYLLAFNFYFAKIVIIS